MLRLRRRLGDDRRLAARQLDRRRSGRLLPRSIRAGQPGKDPRRSLGRAVSCCWPISLRRGSLPPRGPTSRSDRPSPSSPRARSGSAPPPAHGSRGVAGDRRGLDREAPATFAPDGRRRGDRLHSRGPDRSDQAPDRGPWRGCGDRGAWTQATFQACLDATRPGGIVSSLGVYGGKLEVPLESYVYGIGDKQILSTLCPGGKKRMHELMELVRHGRLDLAR